MFNLDHHLDAWERDFARRFTHDTSEVHDARRRIATRRLFRRGCLVRLHHLDNFANLEHLLVFDGHRTRFSIQLGRRKNEVRRRAQGGPVHLWPCSTGDLHLADPAIVTNCNLERDLADVSAWRNLFRENRLGSFEKLGRLCEHHRFRWLFFLKLRGLRFELRRRRRRPRRRRKKRGRHHHAKRRLGSDRGHFHSHRSPAGKSTMSRSRPVSSRTSSSTHPIATTLPPAASAFSGCSG